MNPFFSVIIPTKNRSELVIYAIESVLRQTFDDFEIVLIDNDDTDDTAKAVETFKQDARFHYFRTGNLSMSDNWEYGVDQSCGTYITILEDKQILRKFALAYAHQYLADETHQVATFPYSNMETPNNHELFLTRLVPGSSFLSLSAQSDLAPAPFTVATDVILNDIFFKKSRTEGLPYLPRGITSFVHHSVVKEIQSLGMGRLCADVNPDYMMAFQQLAVVDEVLVLPKRLSLVGNKSSNGFAIRTKKKEALNNFVSRLQDGERSMFDQVPIKAVIIWNAIVNDFLHVKKNLGRNLKDIEVPMDHYFTYCYWDIALTASLGADVADDIAEWNRALKQEDTAIQETVAQNIRPIEMRKRLIFIGSLGYRLDVFSIQRQLKRLFKLSPICKSPIELLEWEEKTYPEMYQLSVDS